MDKIDIPTNPSAPLRPLGRIDVVELLGRIQLYVGEDRVTQEDDEAMTACSKLAAYLMNEMVDQDFEPESEMWEEIS